MDLSTPWLIATVMGFKEWWLEQGDLHLNAGAGRGFSKAVSAITVGYHERL